MVITGATPSVLQPLPFYHLKYISSVPPSTVRSNAIVSVRKWSVWNIISHFVVPSLVLMPPAKSSHFVLWTAPEPDLVCMADADGWENDDWSNNAVSIFTVDATFHWMNKLKMEKIPQIKWRQSYILHFSFYSAPFYPKRLKKESYTHSRTKAEVNHARRTASSPGAVRCQGQLKPWIELATFRFEVNPLYLLNVSFELESFELERKTNSFRPSGKIDDRASHRYNLHFFVFVA